MSDISIPLIYGLIDLLLKKAIITNEEVIIMKHEAELILSEYRDKQLSEYEKEIPKLPDTSKIEIKNDTRHSMHVKCIMNDGKISVYLKEKHQTGTKILVSGTYEVIEVKNIDGNS